MAHEITVNQNGAFYFSQACSEDVFNFSRNKLIIPIVLFQSLWMFFFMAGVQVKLKLVNLNLWPVFTSNLINQTTWLKVKLKLVVNLLPETHII